MSISILIINYFISLTAENDVISDRNYFDGIADINIIDTKIE